MVTQHKKDVFTVMIETIFMQLQLAWLSVKVSNLIVAKPMKKRALKCNVYNA